MFTLKKSKNPVTPDARGAVLGNPNISNLFLNWSESYDKVYIS